MSPPKYHETVEKLARLVIDMNKVGRGFSRWYGINKEEERARQYFKMVGTMTHETVSEIR